MNRGTGGLTTGIQTRDDFITAVNPLNNLKQPHTYMLMTACSCVEMVNAGIMAGITGKRLQVTYSPNGRFLAQETFPKNLPRFVLILISLQRWQHRARNETKHFVSPHLIGPQLHQHDSSVKIKMAAPMEVSLPQTMLQKLLDLSKLESLKFCLKIQVHVIRHIRCQVNMITTTNMKALR